MFQGFIVKLFAVNVRFLHPAKQILSFKILATRHCENYFSSPNSSQSVLKYWFQRWLKRLENYSTGKCKIMVATHCNSPGS